MTAHIRNEISFQLKEFTCTAPMPSNADVSHVAFVIDPQGFAAKAALDTDLHGD